MFRTLLLTCVLCALSPAQVQYQDIVKGPGADWLTYAGTYQGWRYSPLKQITVENAGSMVPKWVYHVPNARGLRTSPLVHKGVMYVTNSNSVYALDARSGRLVWQYIDTSAKDQKCQSWGGDPWRLGLLYDQRQLPDRARPADRRIVVQPEIRRQREGNQFYLGAACRKGQGHRRQRRRR